MTQQKDLQKEYEEYKNRLRERGEFGREDSSIFYHMHLSQISGADNLQAFIVIVRDILTWWEKVGQYYLQNFHYEQIFKDMRLKAAELRQKSGRSDIDAAPDEPVLFLEWCTTVENKLKPTITKPLAIHLDEGPLDLLNWYNDNGPGICYLTKYSKRSDKTRRNDAEVLESYGFIEKANKLGGRVITKTGKAYLEEYY
jgi:hypothetical protein